LHPLLGAVHEARLVDGAVSIFFEIMIGLLNAWTEACRRPCDFFFFEIELSTWLLNRGVPTKLLLWKLNNWIINYDHFSRIQSPIDNRNDKG